MRNQPEQPNQFDVTTEDGMYRFFMRHDGSLWTEKNGEPHLHATVLMNAPGINIFSALAMELETARAKIAAFEAGTDLVTQPADQSWKLLPVDLETHLHDFKAACTIARDTAAPATIDSDDPGYWSHQLRTIARIEAMIAQGPEASLAAELDPSSDTTASDESPTP